MDRVPIQTYVMEYDEETVREAINRELRRGGQVYYVYNRVTDIDEVALRISKLVPDARVDFAHGQMSERELENVMYSFVNGDIDVLVSTTIIETGLDISNVNTMIIHDSDRYGLSQQHKHLKEMAGITGIEKFPIFCPVVDDFYSGMQVTVPLFGEQLGCSFDEIADIYKEKYRGPVVTFSEKSDDGGFLCAGALSGTDGMKISVYGNGERILLTAVYDNLGKGASGAALENLNLVMGKDKAFGLDI